HYPPFTTNNVRSLAELESWQAGTLEAAIEPELPVVDPHHHLRNTAHGRYYLPELAADVATGHNVVATVYIDSQTMHRTDGPDMFRPVGETEFVLQHLATERATTLSVSGLCAGIVGTLDLTSGAGIRSALEAHIAAGKGRFRGIRDPL